MNLESKPWMPSSILLITAGALLAGGLHCILLRLSLLPVDVRNLTLPTVQLAIHGPRLELWLAHFRGSNASNLQQLVGQFVTLQRARWKMCREHHAALFDRSQETFGCAVSLD